MAESLDELAPTEGVSYLGENPFVLPAQQPSAPQAPAASSGIDMAGIAKDRSAQLGRQIAEREKVDTAAFGQIAKDRGRMQKYFDAEAIQPGEFPKWDAEKQSEKYRTDPLQSFGSLASIFALTAAAFTKAPMTNALNGSAAAMNAIREGNDQEFERAFKAWKENNELAYKRHTLMHQQYEDADKLLTTDMSLWKAERAALAEKFGDQNTKLLLDHGLYKDVIDLQESQVKIMTDLQKLNSLRDENAWRAKVAATDPDFNSGDPTRIYQGFNRIWGKGSTMADAQRETYDEIYRNNLLEGKPNAREDALKRVTQATTHFTPTAVAAYQQNQISDAEIDSLKTEFPDLSPAEENIVRKVFGDKSQDGALRTSYLQNALQQVREKAQAGALSPEERTSILNQSLLAAEKEIQSARRQVTVTGQANITPDAAKMIAKRYFVDGDTTALSGLGYGAIGAANRALVVNSGPEIMEAAGIKDWKERIASFRAEMRGASNLGLLQSSMVASIERAKSTMPRVLEISDKIPRTEYPDINRVILAAERRTGDPEVIRLGVAIETLISNYASALGMGSRVLTDNAREHARQLLEMGYSQGQMRAAVDQMMIEMNSELEGTKRATPQFLQGYGDESKPAPSGIKIERVQ